MKKIFISLLLVFVTFISTLPTYAQSQRDIDEKVRILIKCMTDITYPSIITKNGEFVVGIVGDSKTYEDFSSRLNTTKLKDNKRVVVKQITDYSQISSTQLSPIIYLTETSQLSYSGVGRAIGTKPMLFITEKEGLVQKGSDVNFVKRGDKWHYELNKKRAINKSIFPLDKFTEKAINKEQLKDIDEVPVREPPTIIQVENPAKEKRIKELEEELANLRSGKIKVEEIYERTREEQKKSTKSIDDMRTALDTIQSIAAVRQIALDEAGKRIEEAKKAEDEKISRINAENKTKEKEREAKRQQEVANTRLFVIGLIGILGIISTIAVLTFIANRRRQKIINQLEIARNSLDVQNKEIAAQRNELSEQNRQIKDSLRYALTIQQAMLPSKQELNQFFTSYFVMYEPKDIVSGDFYWVVKRPEGTFLAVADCTGHGVPGAFLSTVGNDILNEIINEKHIYEPNQILSSLHTGIYERLKQGETNNKDGMDICLCKIVEQHGNMYDVIFAGAKRPIFYSEDGFIKSMKGDSKYIGGIQEEPPKFNNYSVTLKKGEKLYLSTDGYVDTPNKEKRKFGSTKFQELLQEIHTQDLETQYKIFIEQWEKHKGDVELRDDTTILAVEI